MRSSRIVLTVAVLIATTLLGGCYVASQKLPAGSGPLIDQQLIGAWETLDESGKRTSDNTYLHFVKTNDEKPLVMVMVDDHSVTTYEMHSIKIGKRQMFAVKPLSSTNSEEKPEEGFILGYYEVKGDDLYLNLLDAKKMKALVEANKVKGVAEKSDYGKVTLTGTPQELANFFANTDPAALIGGEKPARAHRISTAK